MDAIVIGTTTEREVTAASREAPFVLNSLLRIGEGEDASIGQVAETYSFNRFLPGGQSAPVEAGVLDALRQLGWHAEGEMVHLATIRLLDPRTTPVPVGARVHTPAFEEVAPYFLPSRPERAWALGVVRGTGSLAEDVPEELRERVPVWRRGQEAPSITVGMPMLFDPYTQHEFPHIGIFGGSGSGKSVALRVLCEEMMHARHPGIVIDPHYELEFTRPFSPAGRFGRAFPREHRVGTVGRDVSIAFSRLTTGLLLRLLEASFGADSFSANMENAVRFLHRPHQELATFRERIEVARWAITRVPEAEGRDAQRIERLKRQHRDILEAGRAIGGPDTIDAVERRVVALQMQGVFGAGRDAAEWAKEAIRLRQLAILRGPLWALELTALYVLEALYHQRRDYRDAVERFGRAQEVEPLPPFWVVADEAHHFAPKNPEIRSATRSIIRTIAQEGRKYGVFLVLASQRPALLNETVTAQLATKLLMRTVRAQDIETLRDETDISAEEARRLPYLAAGEGFLSLGAQGRSVPVRVRVPFTTGREQPIPWDELDAFDEAAGQDDLADAFLAAARRDNGIRPVGLPRLLPEVSARVGRPVSLDEAKEVLERLAAAGRLVKEQGAFGDTYRPNGLTSAAAGDDDSPF